ncbi:hypothetical protein CJ030_MR5G013430 [Morella rubra]|uniref:Uncharacterized protein n=1 Tax=Morella rubra TaxID=262757 RepID=A0A6A1VRF8_9ROSI|nr:hypothetical protein CJ030_MR5G013430 [Morella rubra]
MANPYRSSEGLSSRQGQGANADEIQLRIDPVHGDLDEEISGLHSQVKRLKSSSQDARKAEGKKTLLKEKTNSKVTGKSLKQ